ncbi:MAG: 50S ribosomal protein L11 methyltransferase [Pelagibacterales bacterium]|nr:50S ribosomal protein L11 methyltransferase [Pelagibacterales bacterium]
MIKDEFTYESSSFRDNFGNVFNYKDKILRSVKIVASKNYEFLKDNYIFEKSINSNFLIKFQEMDKNKLPKYFGQFKYVLESKTIPFISYPYEWSFDQLKDAALHHLNFQIFLLNLNTILRDSSAYNVQFINGRPIFIDVLSLKKYEEGEYWTGYGQFCENFLNPLLLGSLKGIRHNDWFKGSLEGISTREFNKILSLKDKISLKILIHIVGHSNLQNQNINNPKKIEKKLKNIKKFQKSSYLFLLKQIKNWIENLKFKKSKTIWENYENEHTYNKLEFEEKKIIVGNFVEKIKPEKLIDLGCNTGIFSEVAISKGATNVVGLDFDDNAISQAYKKSFEKKINFLPLVLNLANPSPNQGWMQNERKGLIERFKSDALVALALEHHLVIGKNIPIVQFLKWIKNIARFGLIEFIPKTDETVLKMLSSRKDIFEDYNETYFEKKLSEQTKIVNKHIISKSGRIIFEYEII